MRLIVDVMNVLHAWRSGPDAGKGVDVAALARAIRRSRFASWEVLLVCDGTPPPGVVAEDGAFEAEGCSVIFSGAGIEADEVIEAVLAGDGPVRETVVVSADRRLGRAAHRRGARSMGSATFAGVLGEDARTHQADSARGAVAHDATLEGAEVNAWLTEFGMGPPVEGAPERRAANDRPESRPVEEDPGDWLDQAQREWEISEDDLDMERWLREGGDPDPKNRA